MCIRDSLYRIQLHASRLQRAPAGLVTVNDMGNLLGKSRFNSCFAQDVYKRQSAGWAALQCPRPYCGTAEAARTRTQCGVLGIPLLSLIHIYECNEKLKQPEYSARGMMRRYHVEVVCTTDDPIDSLEYHIKTRESLSLIHI